ncbi:MAG TPA: MATE family efflux transporter [Caulobacteraceae bacterium]|nr:MATE family efflux transporter [Caulobacteraceae bacterium]
MSDSIPMGRGGPGGPHVRRDLTEGPIAKTLIMFSLPLLGSNALQSLNLTANQFWVSHLLGVTAIAAIGNANVIGFLAQGAIFGATMAANIMIAQAVGAGDLKLVKRVMGTAISFFFCLSVLLAFGGWTFAPHVLTAMHTPPAARIDAIIYLRIVFSAMPFMYFFMFIQMAQRGAGDSRTPFYFMALAVVLDIIFNPLLIAGVGPFPKLGIAGSAASTLIGQSVSLVLLLIHLYRKKSVLMLRPHELGLLKPDWTLLRPLLVRGLPMSLQMFIMSGASMVMIGFVNGFGALTAASYVGAQQVWNYIQMPGMAVGASISSMAGQNVGAGKWDRVSRIAGIGIMLSVAVTGTAAILIYLLGPIPLYPFLPYGSPTIPIALHINRTVLWAFVIFNATFALTGIVRSTGAVWPPLLILIVSMWLIRVPFATFMIPHFGPDAIWWSFPLGTITSSALSVLYYKFGGWRKVRIIHPEAGGEVPDSPVTGPQMDPHEDDAVVATEAVTVAAS